MDAGSLTHYEGVFAGGSKQLRAVQTLLIACIWRDLEVGIMTQEVDFFLLLISKYEATGRKVKKTLCIKMMSNK